MPPGADPMSETPPRLYARNRISASVTPRQHLFCKDKLWLSSAGGQRVAQCGQCENNYFLVPSQHVESKMVGTCFSISRYSQWNKAIANAKEGQDQSPIHCSIFTNGKGMQTPYFGGKKVDAWDSDPTTSPYHPRAFVCTSGSGIVDHYVDGSLEKGYRQMRVFKVYMARFVTCHTPTEDGGAMRCTKQKRIGKCTSFFMRNAAFDSRAAHVPSPNAANVTNWEQATSDWDKTALKLGSGFLEPLGNDEPQQEQLGLAPCDSAWQERLVSLL